MQCLGCMFDPSDCPHSAAVVQSLNSLGMAAAVEALQALGKDAKKLPQAAQASAITTLTEALGDLGTTFARPGVLHSCIMNLAAGMF